MWEVGRLEGGGSIREEKDGGLHLNAISAISTFPHYTTSKR